MKALILWSDDRSTNLGVRVLGAGTAALLETAFPGIETTQVSYGLDTAPMRVGDWRALVKERVTKKHGLLDWLGGFDLAVDTRAGDSFADLYGLQRLTTMSLLSEWIHQAGVPVVLGPQTIGPFESRRGRLLARRTLRQASSVLSRDSTSTDIAGEFGVRAVPTTDVVFALPVPETDRTRDVVLNVSGLLWQESNNHVDSAAYRRTVRSLIARLRATGRSVTLLAHVISSSSTDNDVPAVEELAAELGPGTVEVCIPADLEQVRTVVASAQLVIGSRMHACLNALSCGTPAIPLAYSRKFEPLLADLGWPHTVDLRSDADPVSSVLHLVDQVSSAAASQLRDRAAVLLDRAVVALRGIG